MLSSRAGTGDPVAADLGRSRRPTGRPASRAITVLVSVVLVGAATNGLVGGGGVAVAGTVAASGRAVTPTGGLRLPGTVQGLTSGAQVIGPADATTEVSGDVSLKPPDPGAVDAFVAAVSTPGSAFYGHYLAAGQFGARFGPTAAAVTATRQWLASTGLRVGATSSDGLLIPVSGNVAQMEAAFAVPLVNARLPGGRVARVGTAEPRVPAALVHDIGGVIGLSTVAKAHPQLQMSPVPATGAPAAGGVETHAGAVAHIGPTACAAASGAASTYGSWTADQLASAYGFDTLYGQNRVGAGQTVGIYELEPFTASDVQTYESCYGVNVPVATVAVDGGPVGGQQGEAALDIEAVAGLAPSSSIVVYSGPNNGGTGPIDTYARMVGDDSAKVLTSSWGLCEPGMDAPTQQAETTLFAQAAAQGQTVLAASGDAGSTDCYGQQVWNPAQPYTVDDPADQPGVTGVGGTSLTGISSSPPTETVWNGGVGRGAGGGGVSADFAAPSWQPAAPGREVPDISASSDPQHGDIIYFAGGWVPIGGTSTAAPLWAALTTVINQGCAVPVGFLNPKLYAAGAGGSPPFNDITTGNNDLRHPGAPSPVYPATAHYDLASGWGTPRGAALLSTLSGSSSGSGCPAVTGLSSSSGPAVGGRTVVISGSGFGSSTPTVHFGGAPAAVIGHTATTVSAITPDVGSAQRVAVTVTTMGSAAGTSASVPAAQYTFVSPQISGVSPGKGPTGGGGTVTVYGSDFSGATSVRFGSTAASFTVTSDTSLVATVPPGPSGGATVDVVVQGPDGTSPLVAADRYTYALPGYWLVASDGGIFSFGNAGFHGSTGALALNSPVVGMASTPDDGGYWLVAADGGIFSFGNAGFHGSTGGLTLNKPVVGMASTPTGQGYWLVASDGGIFSFGDANFYGSTGALTLNRPIVGMAASPTGHGYWLVASDGGIFSFGDANFYGSTGALTLNRPVTGMAASATGHGYWLVASDGGIFAFGDAAFHGSTGGLTLNKPVVGMASSLSGLGYWLVASDGGIFSFGDAGFYGSTGALTLNRPIVGMAA